MAGLPATPIQPHDKVLQQFVTRDSAGWSAPALDGSDEWPIFLLGADIAPALSHQDPD